MAGGVHIFRCQARRVRIKYNPVISFHSTQHLKQISTFPLAVCVFTHHEMEAILHNNGLNSVYITLGSDSFIMCRRPWILQNGCFQGWGARTGTGSQT